MKRVVSACYDVLATGSTAIPLADDFSQADDDPAAHERGRSLGAASRDADHCRAGDGRLHRGARPAWFQFGCDPREAWLPSTAHRWLTCSSTSAGRSGPNAGAPTPRFSLTTSAPPRQTPRPPTSTPC